MKKILVIIGLLRVSVFGIKKGNENLQSTCSKCLVHSHGLQKLIHKIIFEGGISKPRFLQGETKSQQGEIICLRPCWNLILTSSHLKPSAGVILWSHGPVATDQGDRDGVWVNPKALTFEGKQILETLLTLKSLAEKERKQMQSIHYRYTKYLSAGKVFLESFKIFIYSNYQIIVFLFKRILGISYTYEER